MTGRPGSTPPTADEPPLTDATLERQLARRGDHPVPIDLAARIVAAAAETPRRRIRFLPRIAPRARFAIPGLVAAVVGVAILAFALPGYLGTTPTSSPIVSPPTTSSSASPSTVGEWRILATSDTANAFWSPDGRWLMLRYGVTNGPPEEQVLDLFDPQGHLIREYQGDAVTWIDARSFLLGRGTYQTDPPPNALIGTVDSDTLTPLAMPYPNGPLSNGHGALAFATGGTYVDGVLRNERNLVWTSDGRTTTLPGTPVAWSRDGTKLAVWNYLSPAQGVGGRPSGWLEVLSWPGLKSIAAARDKPTDTLDNTFDPSGRYLAFLSSAIYVLDLQTGRTSQVVPTVPSDNYAWDASGHLVVPSTTEGSVAVYAVDGTRLTVAPGLGDSAVSSADGSTVVTFFDFVDDARPLTALLGEQRRTVALPGHIYGALPAVSPDGSGLLVVCQVGGEAQALLLTTPAAPASPAPTVESSPSVSAVTISLDSSHSMVLTISDQSGLLAGARAATGAERDDPSRPDGDPVAWNPTDTAEDQVRLLWIGTICDTTAQLVVGPDVQAMTIIEGPRPLCDMAAIGRAAVLTFKQPVTAAAIAVNLARYDAAASLPPGGISLNEAVSLALQQVSSSFQVLSVRAGRTSDLVSNQGLAQGDPLMTDRLVWAVEFSGPATICPPNGSGCQSPRPGTLTVYLDYETGAFIETSGVFPNP